MNSFSDLSAVMADKRAGDQVELVFQQGPERAGNHDGAFSKRAAGDSATARDLAEIVKQFYDQNEAELEQLIQGLSDEFASRNPQPDESSVKECLPT